LVLKEKKKIIDHNHKKTAFSYNSLKLSNRYHLVRGKNMAANELDTKVQIELTDAIGIENVTSQYLLGLPSIKVGVNQNASLVS